MTSKRIEYAPEAIEKMRRRGFSRSDVRWLVAEGEPASANQYPGAEPRFAKRGYIRGREAQAIYLENAERILVISPHWIISKGELARQKKRGK